MTYKTRLLTVSEKVIPFHIIKSISDGITLVSGTDEVWDNIEIHGKKGALIAYLNRDQAVKASSDEDSLKELSRKIQDKYPVKARQWLNTYFTTVRVIYTFTIFPDRMVKDDWLILGGIQNFLKDSSGGIIQADNEGFYNESGQYILWQMYEGATGYVTAAVLNDKGNWVPHSLKLDDVMAVNLFKQGTAPKKGFFSRIFGL
jgi:hypothetical protein